MYSIVRLATALAAKVAPGRALSAPAGNMAAMMSP